MILLSCVVAVAIRFLLCFSLVFVRGFLFLVVGEVFVFVLFFFTVFFVL